MNGTSADKIKSSTKYYKVVFLHDHKTLRENDVVIMTESPSCENVLLRVTDMTLHRLQDNDGQYVHLISV